MYSISLDVIRGIINIRMRGVLTDVQRNELAESLQQALETTPPSDPKEWLLRVTAKPLAQYTPELAANVCRLIEESNSRRKPVPAPKSRVINCRPAQPVSSAARMVHFVTA
jgi:hypothetical protein